MGTEVRRIEEGRWWTGQEERTNERVKVRERREG